jgi:hypothetical protein
MYSVGRMAMADYMAMVDYMPMVAWGLVPSLVRLASVKQAALKRAPLPGWPLAWIFQMLSLPALAN